VRVLDDAGLHARADDAVLRGGRRDRRGEPGEDESFELVRWPSAEIESRLGEIEDAKSLVGLLLYLRDMSRPAVA
jgi:hypothetical protein